MKKLEAIIQPFKLMDVKEALAEIGVTVLTVSEVREADRRGRHTETYRGRRGRFEPAGLLWKTLPRVLRLVQPAGDRRERAGAAAPRDAASIRVAAVPQHRVPGLSAGRRPVQRAGVAAHEGAGRHPRG